MLLPFSRFSKGRPLCKLTLGTEYLGYDNELMANLRCSIYSIPMLLETVWFRSNQQLAVNKSNLDISSKSSPLTFVDFPIMLLNKQQDFMLNDLVANQPIANFKCIARNSLGYSEACDLRQVDKQMLLSKFQSAKIYLFLWNSLLIFSSTINRNFQTFGSTKCSQKSIFVHALVSRD